MDITKVYNDYKQSVYRLAVTYLHSVPEAEDVCQEVFIKLIHNQASVKQDKVKSWLLTVTANECRNRLKYMKRHETTELTDDLTAGDQYSGDVLNAVMALDIKERAVIFLYYYEGYSTKEISKILNLSASAVRSRMERGRNHLKTRLEGER